MKVLVTGSEGFVGKNLLVRLRERKDVQILEFNRKHSLQDLEGLVDQAEVIFHLAGINRPKDPKEFTEGNQALTEELARILSQKSQPTKVILSSSIQAEKDNDYGKSKSAAEQALLKIKDKHNIYIYRLPNVFGKWCKPNYNSAVATFCYNLVNDKPIEIHDASVVMRLVYIDDVITGFFSHFSEIKTSGSYCEISPVYQTTVGELAQQLTHIHKSRETLVTCPVGEGIYRCLHATYLSYLKPEQFSYSLVRHADPRGVFVEFLKTKDSGQFSFFTAGVGITRGGHYHHTKTEKFLVLQGKARYCFRHVVTEEFFEVTVTAEESKVVETIPGWSHDITNVGDDELIVMLWANEIFDREKPDTIGWRVQ